MREIKVEEAKFDRERAKLETIRQRIAELESTISNLTSQLEETLSKSKATRSKDVYRVVQLAKTLRATLDQYVIEPPKKLAERQRPAKKQDKIKKETPKREAGTNLGRPVKLRPNERIERARYPSEQCADGKAGQRCPNKSTRGYYCPIHGEG